MVLHTYSLMIDGSMQDRHWSAIWEQTSANYLRKEIFVPPSIVAKRTFPSSSAATMHLHFAHANSDTAEETIASDFHLIRSCTTIANCIIFRGSRTYLHSICTATGTRSVPNYSIIHTFHALYGRHMISQPANQTNYLLCRNGMNEII